MMPATQSSTYLISKMTAVNNADKTVDYLRSATAHLDQATEGELPVTLTLSLLNTSISVISHRRNSPDANRHILSALSYLALVVGPLGTPAQDRKNDLSCNLTPLTQSLSRACVSHRKCISCKGISGNRRRRTRCSSYCVRPGERATLAIPSICCTAGGSCSQ
jgi:hypothetical protein